MQARVLVIEDVPEMAELVATYLMADGLTVSSVGSAEEAESILASAGFDLILLDLNLPGMDGFQFLQRLRRGSGVPVLVASARDADEDVILALGIGADEYVAKPFTPRTLVARAKALIRRVQTTMEAPRVVAFDSYTVDLDSGVLKRADKRIPLSAKEFALLSFLLGEAGKARTTEEIYEAVWGQRFGDIAAVGVYIQRLRRKLEEDPAAPRIILTERGLGYRMDPAVISAATERRPRTAAQD